MKVLVDGKEPPSGKITTSEYVSDFSSPSRRFTVGDREKHQVVLKIDIRPPPKIELYVDGQKA